MLKRIKYWSPKVKNALVALAFMAAYVVSAAAPFASATTAYADPGGGQQGQQGGQGQAGNQGTQGQQGAGQTGSQDQSLQNQQQGGQGQQGQQNQQPGGSGNQEQGAPGSQGTQGQQGAGQDQPGKGDGGGQEGSKPSELGSNGLSGSGGVTEVREISVQMPSWQDKCGYDEDTYTIPFVAGVNFSVGGKMVTPGVYHTDGMEDLDVVAMPGSGFKFAGNNVQHWSFHFGKERCLTPVVPVEPTKSDKCGTKNDTYTIPDVEGLKYFVNGNYTPAGTYSTNGKKMFHVTVKAERGYKIVDEGKYCWDLCFKDDWCMTKPVKPSAPEVVCGANNDVFTAPEVEGVSYVTEGWQNNKLKVVAVPEYGYYFQKGAHTKWHFTDAATPCPVAVTVPDDPTPVCGPNNDTVVLPEVEHVTYTQTGWSDGKNTVTATVEDGFYIAGTNMAMSQSWTYTDTATACPQVLGATTSTPQLENTGATLTLPMLLSTGLLGVSILAFLQNDSSGTKIARLRKAFTGSLGRLWSQPFTLPV